LFEIPTTVFDLGATAQPAFLLPSRRLPPEAATCPTPTLAPLAASPLRALWCFGFGKVAPNPDQLAVWAVQIALIAAAFRATFGKFLAGLEK